MVCDKLAFYFILNNQILYEIIRKLFKYWDMSACLTCCCLIFVGNQDKRFSTNTEGGITNNLNLGLV